MRKYVNVSAISMNVYRCLKYRFMYYQKTYTQSKSLIFSLKYALMIVVRVETRSRNGRNDNKFIYEIIAKEQPIAIP